MHSFQKSERGIYTKSKSPRMNTDDTDLQIQILDPCKSVFPALSAVRFCAKRARNLSRRGGCAFSGEHNVIDQSRTAHVSRHCDECSTRNIGHWIERVTIHNLKIIR